MVPRGGLRDCQTLSNRMARYCDGNSACIEKTMFITTTMTTMNGNALSRPFAFFGCGVNCGDDKAFVHECDSSYVRRL